jgi:FkbM family methyltransferase
MIASVLLNVLERLQKFTPESDWQQMPIYVYGTGTFARDIQHTLERDGFQIEGFIDHRQREDDVIGNHPIFRDNDSRVSLEQRKRSAVILGIHNREVYIPAIIQRLKQAGYERIVSPIELYDHFAGALKDRYWLTSRTFYTTFGPQIEAVHKLLSDPASRETFTTLLRFRVTGDFSTLPTPDVEHQYFPTDLLDWPAPIRFVDCGAYDGDTLRAFRDARYRFESIAAFEPDQHNFRKLASCVAGDKANFPNAVLFPCGVGASTRQLNFETGRGEASVVTENGPAMIQCISLDDSIPTFRPTLIKMDIEGLEIEALRGAERIISSSQPALAISVYHRPAHLWEIPLYIHQISREYGLRYTYHLRMHAHNGFDTIFYAIPARSA